LESAILELLSERVEGHPLIIRAMVGELKESFNGAIGNYWDWLCHRDEGEVNILDKEGALRRQIMDMIIRLPKLSREMLQRTAVFRREVPASFYCKMLDGDTSSEDACIQACNDLQSRYLVSHSAWKGSNKLLLQHSLVHKPAYSLLKANKASCEKSHEIAAILLENQCQDKTINNQNIACDLIESSSHYMKLKNHIAIISLYCKKWHTGETLQSFLRKTIYVQNIEVFYTDLWESAMAVNNEEIACEARSRLATTHYACGRFNQSIFEILNAECLDRDNFRRKNAFNNSAVKIKEWVSYSYNLLTWNQVGSGQYTQALKSSEQSLVSARKNNDWKAEGSTLRNQGFIYHNLRVYDEAISRYGASLSIYKKINYSKGIGTALVLLGRSFAYRKEFSEAHEHITLGLNILTEECDECRIAIANGLMAELRFLQRSYDEAIEICSALLQMDIVLRIPLLSSNIYGLLGKIYIAIGDNSTAGNMLNRALEISRRMEAKPIRAEILFDFARLYKQLNEPILAEDYGQKAYKLAKSIPIPFPLAEDCESFFQELRKEQGV
jgi:tetratricopeptide (TPR) repeat protein